MSLPISDISGAFEKLSAKLAIEALYRLGCFHRFIRLFSVCDQICFFCITFAVFLLYFTPLNLCFVKWVIN